jgi:hypothetical protein
MPPQPLSRVKPNAEIKWGPKVLQQYPDLCCIVMEAISLGSQIEYNWSVILVDLLRAEPRAGMAMYEALSGGEARRAALRAAARTVLPEDDYLLLQAVEIAIAPARKSRNDLAHHIWGTSDAVPNALLLIDPAGLRKFEVGVATTNLEMSAGRRAKIFPEFDRASVQVWKKRDLEQMRKSTIDALSILGTLSGALNLSYPVPEIDAQTRQQLLKEPQVAQALQRLNKRKTPQAPPQPRGTKRPAKRK